MKDRAGAKILICSDRDTGNIPNMEQVKYFEYATLSLVTGNNIHVLNFQNETSNQ
jgi:hypothetical protein